MNTEPNVPFATEADNHELGFWKQPRDFDAAPKNVLARLREGKHVESLEPLPIDEMIERIAAVFAHWNRIDRHDWEASDGAAFQLFTTTQFFSADCYSMQDTDKEKIVNIGREFGCPVYDVELDRRIDVG